MSVSSEAEKGELALDALELDPENPRIPVGVTCSSQREWARFVADAYDAIEVARSIVRFGYFPSEPLIVIPGAESGKYTVVEGNRRLAALKLLATPGDAEELEDAAEWGELAETWAPPDTYPVVIVGTRQDVAPIVGYRHISGIEPWEPHEKARFIANLVDSQGMDFDEVSSVVGDTVNNVAAAYRNYAIVREAREIYGVDSERVVKRFGVFTRAMNSGPLRNFIRVPAPSEMSPGREVLSPETIESAKELFSWLFGDGEREAVITESRNLTDLGTAVASEDGLRVLRAERDLEAAFIAAGGLRERLLKRLINAANNLAAAQIDMVAYANDDEVKRMVARCQEELQRLVDLGG